MAADFRYSFGADPEQDAVVSICIFPHLQDFIIIDIRREIPGRPRVRLLNTEKVLTDKFYSEVESSFSQLLRQKEQPFAKLLALPTHIESVVREGSIRALLEMINEDVPEASVPQIAIFLFAGPALNMNAAQLTETVRHIFSRELDVEIVRESVQLLEKLLAQERELLQDQEKEDLKQMIKGQSSDYFTLWENRT